MPQSPKLFFLLVAWILFQPLYGQKLPSQLLLEDLRFLNEAIENGHPVNYLRTEKITLRPFISGVEAALPDSISPQEYESIVRKALWEVGCVHTSLSKNPLRPVPPKSSFLFPLTIFTDGQHLFLRSGPADSSSVLKKGQIVVSVNGVSADKIISDMSRFQPSDGHGKTFGYLLMNKFFPSLFQIYYGPCESFEIIARNGQGTLIREILTRESKNRIPPQLESHVAPRLLFSSEVSHFGLLEDSIAYLQITSFDDKKYRSFYRHVFNYVSEHGIDHLILDVRDNLGGSRDNAEDLLSYMVSEICNYQIIRPKSHLMPYLKGKNKRKFLLSYLYFDVRDVFNRSHAESGTAFTFTIKPKKNVFHGQICVLTNGYSASSASLTASYLRHHSDAVIIGQQTAGGEFSNNGGSYPQLVLPGSGMAIRTATYHFKYDFQGDNPDGLIPDYPVEHTVDTFGNTSLELLKALEVIHRK